MEKEEEEEEKTASFPLFAPPRIYSLTKTFLEKKKEEEEGKS